MAYVKRNEDVKNEQDLQNLVIGIIFRQIKPYKSEEIVSIVHYYLKGSKFYDEFDLIEEKVEYSLDLLQTRDRVFCRNGVYYPQNPLKKVFPFGDIINKF